MEVKAEDEKEIGGKKKRKKREEGKNPLVINFN
jgi:hypothetical protein